MADSLHPAASHHVPSFITAPGETDVLMVITSLLLLAAVVAFGLLFLRLHTLPERLAHKSQKIQFEIVAVLCLIALFTHMHIFWVAALLLALIDFPDFGTSLGRIADSTERMAGASPRLDAARTGAEARASTRQINDVVPEGAQQACSGKKEKMQLAVKAVHTAHRLQAWSLRLLSRIWVSLLGATALMRDAFARRRSGQKHNSAPQKQRPSRQGR
jgi:hypothetical protein